MSGAASLSIILGSPSDDLSYVAAVLRCIGRQSIADRIEAIVVSPAINPALPADITGALCQVKFVNTPVHQWADAMLQGLTHASAAVVVFGEDHAFPDAGWAQGLLEAHDAGYAVVGPVIANANPRSGWSCTHWMIDYGRWMIGNSSGLRDDLPGHNSSYRRDLLAGYSSGELHRLIAQGGGFHAELKRNGVRLYLTSQAVVYHTHPSRHALSGCLRFYCGRIIGATRMRNGGWKLSRRLFYAAAAPALHVMRWRYVLQSLRLAGQTRLLRRPRVLGALALGLLIGSIGEAWGYLFGFGDVVTKMGFEEFHKLPQLNASDVKEWRSKWEPPETASPPMPPTVRSTRAA